MYNISVTVFGLLYRRFIGVIPRECHPEKRNQNEIVFDRLWCPLSILLLAAIGAKLIGPHGGLQVGKKGLLA